MSFSPTSRAPPSTSFAGGPISPMLSTDGQHWDTDVWIALIPRLAQGPIHR